jgi:hypothetical protein
MAQKRSLLAKIFIWWALIAIWITVISPFAMYFGFNSNSTTDCADWMIRDEETQECVEEDVLDDWEGSIDTQEWCEALSWTWYEANQVCILQ